MNGSATPKLLESLPCAIQSAHHRIGECVLRTPVEALGAADLGVPETRGSVVAKMECWQDTGSFKLRGATNKILQELELVRERGVVTASTGNHALAVCRALKNEETDPLVFVPVGVSPAKEQRLRSAGASLRIEGIDSVETEQRARAHALASGAVYVSPYSDPQIVAGQGTVGFELERQVPRLETVLVTIGGGGLASGVAAWLKHCRSSVEIIGCQPRNSPVMYESVRRGRIYEMDSLEALSDGSAGGIEPDSVTFELCRSLIDRYLLVDEDQIAAAMATIARAKRWLVEGAAAVTLAAYRSDWERLRDRHVALIFCGGNVDLSTIKRVLREH